MLEASWPSTLFFSAETPHGAIKWEIHTFQVSLSLPKYPVRAFCPHGHWTGLQMGEKAETDCKKNEIKRQNHLWKYMYFNSYLSLSWCMASQPLLPVRFFNPVSIETLPILQKMAMRLQSRCNANNWKRIVLLKDYGSYLYWNPWLHKRTNILI